MGKKRVAAVPKHARKTGNKSSVKDWKNQHSHLFKSNKRNYRIGGAVQPKRDLTRFVKWPRYVRIQRQRAILKQRLKVPPAIHQFAQTVDKNTAATLFNLFKNYRPESADEKKQRLQDAAKTEVKDSYMHGSKKAKTFNGTSKPKVLKFGLNHITELVESKKAKLVVIAHDVDPIELVVWLPALCRKMGVPFCIIKGKARLGYLVRQKTCTAVALTDVRKEDIHKLDQIVASCNIMYGDAPSKKWGGGINGSKSQARQRKLEAAKAK
jgi:large subunit ribosomal protein L7Ae